jgi:hypothetical protein
MRLSISTEPSVPDDDTRHLFFQVSGSKVMLMSDVSYSPDPRCNGPNLFGMDHPK